MAIYFDPQIHSKNFVIAKVENELFSYESLTFLSKEHVIPVIYDGEDLQRIAYLNNLETEKIISFHSQSSYTVAMIGFQPNFPYLIGLPELLETPRLESPRKKVPAGSVAIGGAQTGIYPSDSPGGWNLIGRMNPDKLKVLQPGDKVKFYEVKNEDQL